MATFEEAQYDFIRNSPSGERHISEVGAFNSGFRAGASSRDAEVARFHTALAKINDIRNSIIGYQNMNFSAHVYPLVAALNEAGFEGMGYEEASKLAQTQVELIADLRSKIEATRALAERLIQGGGVFEVITAKQFLATLGKQGEGR